MIKKGIVTEIVKGKGFYGPHIVTDVPSYAGLPEELFDKVEVGDEVTIFADSNLSYGGFGAIVIATPKTNFASL